MKKKLFLTLLFGFSLSAMSQSFRNFGNTELHNRAQVGFFDDVTNDAIFENSSGLVGFYGSSEKSFSGSVTPIFFDVEIANDEGWQLNIPLEVSNNVNFIYGDILTDKSNNSIFLEILETGFYTGATNFSKTNGRLKFEISSNFIAPIGDADFLRPIAINPLFPNSQYTTAYFFDEPLPAVSFNPDNPISVINSEYWILEGNNPVGITLSWNERSGLSTAIDSLNKLIIIGYNKTTLQWDNLGNNNLLGDFNNGFISSNEFLPSEYQVITFGILNEDATDFIMILFQIL